MENELQTLVLQGLSQRQIANILGKSQGFVKHNLGKLNLKTLRATKNLTVLTDGIKTCSQCGTDKSVLDFYKKRKGVNAISNICKKCSNENTINQQVKMKLKMIEYKGGKCEKCPVSLINTHYCVFDFHHIDPTVKDKNFATIRSWSWERIEKELKNCRLLCSNCHRIEHAQQKKNV